jgi:regulator of nonsense transcripts 2
LANPDLLANVSSLQIAKLVHKLFTKPWKIRYSNIGLLAMLTYDLQRYHPSFAIAVIDQVLEDVRFGLEVSSLSNTMELTFQTEISSRQTCTRTISEELRQQNFSESYIFTGSSARELSLILYGLWWRSAIVSKIKICPGQGTHLCSADGRPNPSQPSPIDAPDDFFRVRLICILLDGCGMCFDRGSLRKRLDVFLTFFQVSTFERKFRCPTDPLDSMKLYVLSKDPLPMDVDFMLSDTLEVATHFDKGGSLCF